VLGVSTNRAFLVRVLEDPVFAQGQVRTSTLAERADLAQAAERDPDTLVIAAALLASGFGPWTGFRTGHPLDQPLVLDVDGQIVPTALAPGPSPGLTVHLDGRSSHVQLSPATPGSTRRLAIVDGVSRTLHVARHDRSWWLQHGADTVCVRRHLPSPAAARDAADPRLVRAPSSARVLEVGVAPGDRVQVDQIVCLVEAMKIETRLRAAAAGTVAEVRASAGESCAAGDVLVVIDVDPEPEPAPGDPA